MTAFETPNTQSGAVASARQLDRLAPWFDDRAACQTWLRHTLVIARSGGDVAATAPAWLGHAHFARGMRPTLGFVEPSDAPVPCALLVERVRDELVLRAVFTRPASVHLSFHAKYRADQRLAHLIPERERRLTWLRATCDMAVRANALSAHPPAWLHGQGGRRDGGWVERPLGGEQVALLVAPVRGEDRWAVVTVVASASAWPRWRYRLARMWRVAKVRGLRLARQSRAQRAARAAAARRADQECRTAAAQKQL